MSILAPAFLAGLGLIAIPILIHLTQRQRTEIQTFPSLMFLRKVPFKTSNRRRIRHPLLFALRCLALALLALGFARPFVTGGGVVAGESARDVVVLLDTSASLRYGDRWTAALDEARAVLAGLEEGDRAAIVTFAETAEERVPLTADLAAVGTALGDVEPTDLGTRIESGLQLAGRILSESDRASREIVLISDFQRTGWEDAGRARLPDGVALTPVSLADDRDANLAISGATFAGGASDRSRIVARVTNMGDEAVAQLPVSLMLSGRLVQTHAVDIGPRGAASVAFEGVAIPEGRTRGELTISSDPLAVDDALRFIATPDRGLEVLLLEGGRGREDRSLFLDRALAIGDEPRLRPVRRPADQLDPAWLASASAVILNDGDLTDAGRATRLHDWVGGGGALLIVLGPGADPARWAAPGAALLGGQAGPVVDRTSAGGVRLSWLDYDHPVFELFSAPRSGDFSEARFFRFRGFEPGEGARVVARFEGGEPALVETSIGEGRVLVWLSTLDRFWNDLALQPVFLPFVHRALLHAVRYREPERWVSAGGLLELGAIVGGGTTGAPPLADSEWVLVTPDGARRPIEVADGPTWIEFEQTGFYQIERLESNAAPITIAVNAPVSESDLSPVATERVVAAVVGAAANAEPSAAVSTAPGDEDAPAVGRELWWPLLALAGLVLAAESIIANRWTRRRTTTRLAESA